MSKLNRRLALALTSGVGTMWAFYAFCVLALVSAPYAFRSGSILVIVAWIAQTFLQLVLLPAIMVGQNIAAEATEIRDRETHDAVMEMIGLVRQEQQELIALLARSAPRRKTTETR